MDTAARVWVSVEKDVWQAALLLSRTKDTAEVIIEKGGWVLDPSTSSPGLKWASQYGQVAGASGSGNNGSAGIPESTRGHPTVISLAQATLVLRNPEHLEGIDDLVKLQFLDEPNIIHNLSLRYSTGKIYTNTGPILIAVNPWRNLYIYSPEVMDMYKGRGTPGELPPHVFSVADNAYRAMLREQRNQSILVSGESGAGKTESTKFIMSFLAYVSAAHGCGAHPPPKEALAPPLDSPPKWQVLAAKPVASLEMKVLDSNPLLEAFGNAKTLRNDNSSRFGKYIDLHFGSNGALLGGSIQTYLLEKARVVQQASGERNFHIFHELMEGSRLLSPELQARLRISTTRTYHYLQSHTPSPPTPGRQHPSSPTFQSKSPEWGPIRGGSTEQGGTSPDADVFQTTLKALLGVAGEELMDKVLCVVAAVLHLGNIEIAAVGGHGEEASHCEPSPSFEAAISLLGVAGEDLESSLCRRSIVATSEDRYELTVSQEQARYSRDALAKALYTRLFSRLVKTINESLKEAAQERASAFKTSVLDIFGFEFFTENRFEQFCINYANEKLQQFFVDFVFKVEQTQYIEEGIGWESVQFLDNVECLSTIEGKQGILSLLDEVCILPQGTDERFSDKVRSEMEGRPHFDAPNFPRDAFCIHHYAGVVTYACEKFVDSNRDFLQPAIIELMTGRSESPFLRELFDGGLGGGRFALPDPSAPPSLHSTPHPAKAAIVGGKSIRSARSTILFASVTTQFRRQLTTLVQEISKTSPHFVRCVNPNKIKSPGSCNAAAVLEQLRCGGVMDAVHVTRSGFGSRYPYADFIQRYGFCAPLAGGEGQQARSSDILRLLGLDASMYRLGHTKLFLRHNVIEVLETRRSEILSVFILSIQCAWKQHCCRAKLRLRREQWDILRSRASLLITASALASLAERRWRAQLTGAKALQAVVRRRVVGGEVEGRREEERREEERREEDKGEEERKEDEGRQGQAKKDGEATHHNATFREDEAEREATAAANAPAAARGPDDEGATLSKGGVDDEAVTPVLDATVAPPTSVGSVRALAPRGADGDAGVAWSTWARPSTPESLPRGGASGLAEAASSGRPWQNGARGRLTIVTAPPLDGPAHVAGYEHVDHARLFAEERAMRSPALPVVDNIAPIP